MKLDLKTGVRTFVTSPRRTTRMVFEMQSLDTIGIEKKNKKKLEIPESSLSLILDKCKLGNCRTGFHENLSLKLSICTGNDVLIQVFVHKKVYFKELILLIN